MAFLIGGLLLIFAIVCGVVGAYFCSECDGDKPALGVVSWVFCVLLAIAFILVPFSMHQVDESEVCVVKQFGEVKEVVTKPGMFFDIWVGKSYKRIDTKTQDLVIEAKSIIKEFGNEKALTERITSVLTETPKAVLSTRTAMDIIANRGAITPEITEAAKAAVADKYPIEITTVAISNIDFSDAFEQAVEEKMIAEQNKLKADYENEKKIATAEAEAKVKVASAKANAEAKEIEAAGEAKANELLKQSITPEVLEKLYLDKWDGKLPSVVAGDEASLLLPAA